MIGIMDIQDIVALSKTYPELAGAQHFFVGKEIEDFAHGYAREAIMEHDYGSFPISSILPASRMTISLDGDSALFLLAGVSDKDGGTAISVVMLIDDPLYAEPVGRWYPGSDVVKYKDGADLSVLWHLAHIVALINEPRVLARTPQGTRQVRRQAQRAMGFTPDAWTRVSWDLSKATAAKIARDPTFRKVPLHWRRGHFRKAEAHYKGAIQRPDAIRKEDRHLWWQWIDGQHVGHPIFGIKKSKYAPRMTGADIARRGNRVHADA